MRQRPGTSAAAKAFEERTGIRAPRIVAWEITRSCNLACAHCRAAAHSEPYPGELSLEECKRVVDDIAAISDPILILTGGEPLIRSDIWDIIDYAREAGLHPVIGTNGTLIDDACAARIAEHGIPRVSVSLDFPTPEGQDAFRGKQGAFDEALTGIRHLRAHGVEVQVNTTITKMNNHLVDDMHDLALAEGAVAFHRPKSTKRCSPGPTTARKRAPCTSSQPTRRSTTASSGSSALPKGARSTARPTAWRP